jgi:predicted alpha/beta superfamily hydrolase
MKLGIYLIAINMLFIGCTNKLQQKDIIPNHSTFNIESSQVGEIRVINVWTPSGYQNSTDSLPVLFMPDGGINEDFPHIANTLAELVVSKSIPPFILVGIENTERRRDLTGPSSVKENEEVAPLSDGAKKFRAFIEMELFPEIDKRYRTNHIKGLVGESVAGLFVVETLFLAPEMFDYYIAIDPSLWWNDANLVKTAKSHLANLPEKDIKLWFAGSDATDISKHTQKFHKILETNAPKSLNWKYVDKPNEHHHTIFRATKVEAFVWALNP